MAYKIVKSSSGKEEPENKSEVLVDSSSDLAGLPENLSPGSIAYTATLTSMWMKSLSGTWEPIGGS